MYSVIMRSLNVFVDLAITASRKKVCLVGPFKRGVTLYVQRRGTCAFVGRNEDRHVQLLCLYFYSARRWALGKAASQRNGGVLGYGQVWVQPV